jgi:hypothetical protein
MLTWHVGKDGKLLGCPDLRTWVALLEATQVGTPATGSAAKREEKLIRPGTLLTLKYLLHPRLFIQTNLSSM